MNDLIEQLGINWKLFISQAVNFFILLLILRAFVYKPVLNMIKNREQKIKEGLDKAEEATTRLKEIDQTAIKKLKEAEGQSILLIRGAENRSKALEQKLMSRAEARQKELTKQAEISFQKQKEEAKGMVLKSAAELVKKALIKTIELDPKKIDDSLIEKAVLEIRQSDYEATG